MSQLEAIRIETGPKPQASVIWMHGLGADGNDFVPIVHELDLTGAPDIRFVFPHAPMQPVSINNGYVMRAWYDVKWGDLEGGSKQPDDQGVRASQAAIAQLIDREVSRGTQDGVIQIAMGAQSRDILVQNGYDVEWHEYPMAHSVCLEEIRDISAW